MPVTRPPSQPWYHSLNIDVLVRVLKHSIFHPFVASLIPLCLLAIEAPYDSPAVKNTVYWAIFICILHILGPVSDRIAYGKPRKVEQMDEVVVITGGGSGLGKCIAETYSFQGVDVAVLDIKPATDPIKGVTYLQTDIGDRGAVKKAWAKIEKEIGTPTVLIHCAAIVHGKNMLEMKGDDIRQSYLTNVMAQYTLNQLFIPAHKDSETGGTIVTVSSVTGRLGPARMSAYSATKAALTAMHNALAAELKVLHPNIKTILVEPSQLSTELFSSIKLTAVQRFITPIVDVSDLSMKIVKMVGQGRGGVIAEPFMARWVHVIDILPAGLITLLKGVVGVDVAMNNWPSKKGVPDMAESMVLVDKDDAAEVPGKK